jgi:hypothetical protein
MNNNTRIKSLLCVTSLVFCTIISLSGCTTIQTHSQKTHINDQALLGTWVGSLEMPVFGRENNTTITQITFANNRSEMVLLTGNRTYLMNYTYIAAGGTLVLTPLMNNRNGFAGRQPMNWSQPQNGTMFPWNRTGAPNGTQPPENKTWLSNGTNPYQGGWPSNGTQPSDQRASMNLSFNYAVDAQANLLILNNVQFTKLQ